MKKIAVVLAGCGTKDGSEIHESVLTLLSIKKYKADYACFSQKTFQYHVIDHTTNEQMPNEKRNMFTESARISRGEIKDLKEYNPNEFDALIFPGGFGVAKNLFTYAIDGVTCNIDPLVEQKILDTIEMNKPIGAICISSLLIARALRDSNLKFSVTVGTQEELMNAVKNMGGTPIEKNATQICYDTVNNIVSTPAYIMGKDIVEVSEGIDKLVKRIIEL